MFLRLQACGFQFFSSLVVTVTADHVVIPWLRHGSELADVSHVILFCVDNMGDSMILGMLLPLLCGHRTCGVDQGTSASLDDADSVGLRAMLRAKWLFGLRP